MDQYLPALHAAGPRHPLLRGERAGRRALVAPKRPTAAKLAPYECGIVPRRDPPDRFPVRFYLVAMIFIIFDIEIIFLYPYAVAPPGARARSGSARWCCSPWRCSRRSSTSSPTAPSTGVRPSGRGSVVDDELVSADPHVDHDHPAGRPRGPRAPTSPARRRSHDRRRSSGSIPTSASTAPTTTSSPARLEGLVKWARPEVDLPGHLRAGLLRHRDDGRPAGPTTTSPATAWRCSGPRPARPTS